MQKPTKNYQSFYKYKMSVLLSSITTQTKINRTSQNTKRPYQAWVYKQAVTFKVN